MIGTEKPGSVRETGVRHATERRRSEALRSMVLLGPNRAQDAGQAHIWPV